MSNPNDYNEWFSSTFGSSVKAPATIIAASWPPDTKWGHEAHSALLRVEVDCVKELISEIRDQNIPGDFAEFGVFKGWWVSRLWELTEEAGLQRNVYGFDSFRGLSKPHSEFDVPFWQEGQYACDLDTVRLTVKASERTRIKLVEGYFSESLRSAEAASIGQLSYVRIDCDIYEPALQCLHFIGSRLTDGAILIFDDWPFLLGVGEQRAFAEWLPTVPRLKFEFLFYNTYHHLYLKVHHR